MSKTAITSNLNLQLLSNLRETIMQGNTYGFIGDAISEGITESDIKDILPSERLERIEVLRSMIYGKRILPTHVELMIRNIEWEENSVYAMYDDIDVHLGEKNYYVIVSEQAGDANIFKCLDNNFNGPSTIKPLLPENPGFKTENIYGADGYVWKWLATISDAQIRKFRTDDYFPISSRVDDATRDRVPGEIEVVKIEDPGANYFNYFRYTLRAADILDPTIVGDQLRTVLEVPPASDIILENGSNIRLQANNPGQFDGCVAHCLRTGQYAIVQQTTIVNGKMTVLLSDSIDIESGDEIEIAPAVVVVGNGLENNAKRAIGKAIVDVGSGRGISRVEMLEQGEDYSYAIAEVSKGSYEKTNNTTFSPAIVRPIIPPRNGHGTNLEEELGARACMVVSEFSGDEGGQAPTNHTFSRFGIIQDPAFANVSIDTSVPETETAGSINSFVTDENITHFSISPQFLENVRLINPTTLEANTALVNFNFAQYFEAGDKIFVIDRSVGYAYHYAEITSVGQYTITMNNASATLSSNIAYDLELYRAKDICTGVVIRRDDTVSNRFYAKRVTGKLEIGGYVVGHNSNAIGQVLSTNINDRIEEVPGEPTVYQFDTFIQCVKCIGAFTGDVFQSKTKVYNSVDGNIVGTADVVTVDTTQGLSDAIVYLTNVEGELLGATLTDDDDQTFNVTYKYNGDLDVTAGRILYLQNDIPVARDSISKETIRVILEL